MPQMAPYNWLTLNLMFSLIMMIYILYTHYIPTQLIKKFNKNNKLMNYKLKW